MNYIEEAVNDLKYFTPQIIIDKIKNDCIIGNPPYETTTKST
jgi:tRNA1(Val) A37 N6-methylase TrmN6